MKNTQVFFLKIQNFIASRIYYMQEEGIGWGLLLKILEKVMLFAYQERLWFKQAVHLMIGIDFNS